jgi:hypothetical protein
MAGNLRPVPPTPKPVTPSAVADKDLSRPEVPFELMTAKDFMLGDDGSGLPLPCDPRQLMGYKKPCG